MSTARAECGARAHNGFIYAVGGKNGTGVYLNTVEVYNPLENFWEVLASRMLTARGSLGVAILDSNLTT